MSRSCYCELWERNPERMEKEGIPRGFCGLCRVCRKPGHTMPFPGSAPITAAWCRFHYWKTATLNPYGSIGCLLYSGVVLAALLWLVLRARH